MQELRKETVNELLKEVQVWMKRRCCAMAAQEGPSVASARLSDHIQKVLDRTKPNELRTRLVVISNFQDLPDCPSILMPSNWCTYGFVLPGGGNFGTEVIDE